VLLILAGVFGLVFGVGVRFVLFSFLVSFTFFAVALLLFVAGLGWMAYALLSGRGEASQQSVPTL
jgi:hypothetical protein